MFSKANIVMVDYCMNFTYPIKPHGQTEFSATAFPCIRTKLKIVERIKKTLDKKTDDIHINAGNGKQWNFCSLRLQSIC